MNTKTRVSFALLSLSATLAHAEWYDISSATGANASYLGSKKYIEMKVNVTPPVLPSYINMPSPGLFSDYVTAPSNTQMRASYASQMRLNFQGVNFNDAVTINRKKCDYRILADVKHYDIANNAEVQNSRVMGLIIDSSERPMGVYAYTSTNLLQHVFTFPYLFSFGGPETSPSYEGYNNVDYFSPPQYPAGTRQLRVSAKVLSVSNSTMNIQLDSNFEVSSCKMLYWEFGNNCSTPFSSTFLSSPAVGVFGVPKITGATFQSTCAP